jgi:hypothetical protein
MATSVTLPSLGEEDALGRIITWLRVSKRTRSYPQSPADLHLPDLFHQIGTEVRSQNPALQGAGMYTTDLSRNTSSFYAATWGLVGRGILFPVTSTPQVVGQSFTLTEYGQRWLDGSSGLEWVPSQPGRAAELLRNHSSRFGAAFLARAMEAVACYRGQTYLACCTMCGAASESIILAVAAEKLGDRNAAEVTYARTGGRSKIEKLLLQGRNKHIQTSMQQFLELLKYWRDDAAHGMDSSIAEEEAFVSILLLLRFAAFAEERWEELVQRDPMSREITASPAGAVS